MLTVHLRINDSATGKPTPVRLRITGPDGTTYAPLGRFPEFPLGRNESVGGHLKLGGERWCYVDASCEVPLPAGVPLRIQATKGPEYKPLDETVTLGPGQMALRFSIARNFDSRAKGYHPGDVRCHFLSPPAALLEATAEDLDVVNVLATPCSVPARDGNTYVTALDLLAFSGQQPALTAPQGHSVAVNTMNVHPILGKVALLHSHRPVFPLSFGGSDETDDWSICDWCDQCHRKGGLTVWVDAFEPVAGILGGEALIAAILGKIDAIEIASGPRTHPLLPWVYRLWDAGFMVPLAGGSGKDSNRVPLGGMRTYARVPGEFSLPGWIEAIRAGRTFVTTAPLFEFEVNGSHPGDVVDVSGEVVVRAKVESLVAFERVEVLVNGEVIASAPQRPEDAFVPNLGCWSTELTPAFTPTGSSWVAAVRW